MREVEQRYHDSVVVIGVHSAKFPTEREPTHLADAVRRLEIDHLVINDADFSIWQAYAVRAWPTLMFLDPTGKVFAKHEGEIRAEELEPFLDAALAEFERNGLLDRRPLDLVSIPPDVERPLSYPAAVVADAGRGQLFISDSNHNRIVVATLDGDVRMVFGVGEAGFGDGPPGAAQFNHPQGLALDGDMLYVADTENHSLRSIRLSTGETRTVAGTGAQTHQYTSGGPALTTPLNSPWGVVVVDGTLYIAMAGNHQIWTHRIGGDEVRRFAGSGHEGLRDGPSASAHLAQPSGITRFGERPALLFTDSETSSLRVVDLPGQGGGMVTTLIGQGLFEFGDIDGGRDDARMQHPLGVAYDVARGLVYVADSYNDALKRYDPATGLLAHWVGGDGSLAEPGGMSIAGDDLFVADTNHHAIKRINLTTGDMATVELRGL